MMYGKNYATSKVICFYQPAMSEYINSGDHLEVGRRKE